VRITMARATPLEHSRNSLKALLLFMLLSINGCSLSYTLIIINPDNVSYRADLLNHLTTGISRYPFAIPANGYGVTDADPYGVIEIALPSGSGEKIVRFSSELQKKGEVNERCFAVELSQGVQVPVNKP
jgi:hypothetical protein